MAVIGDSEPYGARESAIVAALYWFFDNEPRPALPLTTRITTECGGVALSDPLTKYLTMSEALDRLHAFAPDQMIIVWKRFRDGLSVDETARDLHRRGDEGRAYVTNLEREAVQQLIRWVYFEYDRDHGLPLYESPSTRFHGTRRNLTAFIAKIEAPVKYRRLARYGR